MPEVWLHDQFTEHLQRANLPTCSIQSCASPFTLNNLHVNLNLNLNNHLRVSISTLESSSKGVDYAMAVGSSVMTSSILRIILVICVASLICCIFPINVSYTPCSFISALPVSMQSIPKRGFPVLF